MHFYCFGSMTLYYRAIWPVARALLRMGHSVAMPRRSVFDKASIKENPKNVQAFDEQALGFICDNTGMNREDMDRIIWVDGYEKYVKRFLFKKQKYDAVITVNKCLYLLAECLPKQLKVVLPYQNIPDLYLFREMKEEVTGMDNDAGFMFSLRERYPDKWVESGLPFSDMMVNKLRHIDITSSNKVLLLHPGGFRGVVTTDGDSFEDCIAKQKELYRSIQRILPPGFSLGLKIHPLAAKWHDYEYNKPICDELGMDIHDGWIGDCLDGYRAIISLGSSTIYETVGTPVPCFVAGFIGGSRVGYYESIAEFYAGNAEELQEKIINADKYVQIMTKHKVLSAFHCPGDISEQIAEQIVKALA